MGAFRGRLNVLLLLAVTTWAAAARAQTCLTVEDMDAASRAALTTTAKNYFDLAAKQDFAGLKQNAIPSLAGSFAGIEAAVAENKDNFTGAQATPRDPFLLKVDGNTPLERGEFLCGVFGPKGQTAKSAVFVLTNLPPGSYAVEVIDVAGGKWPVTAAFILQQEGTAWKLGGLQIKRSQINGHDSNWYAEKARAFKAKGQMHNAWLYFLQARDLVVPVSFMSTLATDKLYDESQAARPPDVPPLDLNIGGTTYKLTDMFPLAVVSDFDVVVKYQAADVSNTGQTFQQNTAVMKAVLAKYPELRDAFDGMVVRAVEPSGRDYGSMLAMKDIK